MRRAMHRLLISMGVGTALALAPSVASAGQNKSISIGSISVGGITAGGISAAGIPLIDLNVSVNNLGVSTIKIGVPNNVGVKKTTIGTKNFTDPELIKFDFGNAFRDCGC